LSRGEPVENVIAPDEDEEHIPVRFVALFAIEEHRHLLGRPNDGIVAYRAGPTENEAAIRCRTPDRVISDLDGGLLASQLLAAWRLLRQVAQPSVLVGESMLGIETPDWPRPLCV